MEITGKIILIFNFVKGMGEMNNKLDRIKDTRLHNRVVTPEEAAEWIKDGMTLGLSGFTRAGDVKAVPFGLVETSKNEILI